MTDNLSQPADNATIVDLPDAISKQHKFNPIENLKGHQYSWQPGQTGNPNGRPPNKSSITYWYKKLLEENEGMPAQQIALKAIQKAREGSLPHIQEITDRTDGKVVSEVNLKGVMLHIGDEYAELGLEAVKRDLEQRKQRLLSEPKNGQ